jgi:hypothetical protein
MQEEIDRLKNEKLSDGFELDKLRQKTKNDKEQLAELRSDLMSYKTLDSTGFVDKNQDHQVDRRSTVDVKGYLKKLNEKVDVDELMDSEMEK